MAEKSRIEGGNDMNPYEQKINDQRFLIDTLEAVNAKLINENKLLKEKSPSDGLTEADNIIRWLDSGWYMVMWANPMGSYSAALVKRDEICNGKEGDEPIIDVSENRITDDFTPTKALIRLAQKPLK